VQGLNLRYVVAIITIFFTLPGIAGISSTEGTKVGEAPLSQRIEVTGIDIKEARQFCDKLNVMGVKS